MVNDNILTKTNCNIIIMMFTLKAVIERMHDVTVNLDIPKACIQGGHNN